MDMRIANAKGGTFSYKKGEQPYTVFRLSRKQETIMIGAILLNGVKPLKKSRLFYYFIAKGDHLNGEKRIRKYNDVINVLTGQLES